MTLDQQIELLQGVKAGRVLQDRPYGNSKWTTTLIAPGESVRFHIGVEYRLKPEPRKWWLKVSDGSVWTVGSTREMVESSLHFGEVIQVQEVLP